MAPLFFYSSLPPPAESLGNQVGRLTFIFLSSWGLEAHTTLRNGCRCHRHCDFFGVWSGSVALAESRPVDVCLETIYGLNSGVFLSTLLHCLILTGAWFGPLSRVCLHAYYPIYCLFFCPQGYVHLYVVSPSPSLDCFSPRRDANRLRRRPESPDTCFYIRSILDQYLSTDSSV